MKQPYIGVSGFMSRKEVEYCLQFVPEGANRLLMVGVLASQKTIHGETNSHPKRYARRENYSEIFVDDPRVLNLIHFGTDNPQYPSLYDDLMLCAEHAGPNLDGFQINAVWPDAVALDKVKRQLPKARFVIQVSPHLIGYASLQTMQLVIIFNRLYKAIADDIIIDFSRGQGTQLPTDIFLKYARAFNFDREHPRFGLTGAGGLSESNVVNVIGPIANEFTYMSVDVENGVRDVAEGGGNLVLDRTGKYIERSQEMFNYINNSQGF